MSTTSAKKPTRTRKLAPVLVTMVLDRSGSMGRVRDETIEAFNSYVEQLRNDKGETFVTLRQFDDFHQLDYEAVPAAEVPILDRDSYQPRGATALNDAIALGISSGDAAIMQLPKNTKQLLVVITDGKENHSCEHTQASIKELVVERETQGWTVVFLQGNLDLQHAQHAAAFYGIAAGNVASYNTHLIGSTSAAMDSLGAVTRSVSCSAGSSSSAFADAGVDQDHTKTSKP